MSVAVSDTAPDNIWDAAIALDQQRRLGLESGGGRDAETSLVVVGSAGTGKSTLVYRFLDRQEAAKPTLALEYTYARRKNQDNTADVCHIWELGGGTLFTNLLETPLSPTKLAGLRVVALVDLSEPSRLWATLEAVVAAVQGHVQNALKSSAAQELRLEERLRRLAAQRQEDGNGIDHPDAEKMRPLLIPLLILGAKYDEFQNMEPEKKKIICRALRYIAHYYGATLQFYSAKDSGLLKKTKEVLSHLAFGTDAPSGMSQDYNKPLLIPTWSDSFQSIAGGEDASASTNSGTGGFDLMKHHFTTHFPQAADERSAVLGDDPARDANFREPEVDKLRAQKDDDLERYRKEIERRYRSDDFEASGRY